MSLSLPSDGCSWGSGVFSVLFTAVPIHVNETDYVPGIPPNVPCPPSWEGVHFGSCCCPALATPGTSQEPDWLPLSSSPREGEHRLIPAADGGRVPECSPPMRNTKYIQNLASSHSSHHHHCGPAVIIPPLDYCSSHLQVAPTSQGHPIKHLSGLVTPSLKTLWRLLSHLGGGKKNPYLSPQG